ncbi:glycosyltransferase involved in cell wall biosynthesis [Rubricella aquisinus]|uniref:Glycosyltransferase involved in cell wall biosynthesis n=1 Tax=Rubricella aquisinus TaxID=2028108 RepID=A0A840WK51_9RHOB|nr:glycosyltransferase [Rubricella aquisinus]MBB5514553.1 glycosyltransferase involved in cell wall biosynthesis [Rubricella aquisinus]
MKVALIGNMNNNNFAMLRYFRDLGVDAHLFLYEEDGRFAAAHFAHTSDTHFPEKYDAHITRTPIHNHMSDVLGGNVIARIAFYAMYWAAKVKKIPHAVVYKPPKHGASKEIERLLSSYDVLIGSGYAPAIFAKAGRDLTIFYPYSTGVEGVGCVDEQVSTGRSKLAFWATYPFYQLCRKRQIQALKKTKLLVSPDGEASLQTFKEDIGREGKTLALPMFYNLEDIPADIPAHLQSVHERIRQHDVAFVSHARHLWQHLKGMTPQEHSKTSKNNHWVFEAFAALLEKRKDRSPLLITFDYGKDAPASKALCTQLGIEDNVLWLPTMARKDIALILSWCDAGIGEFYSEKIIWGGTGWETLAAGKPLIQGYLYEDDAFEQQYGYPVPPLLKVRTKDDVLAHLLSITNDPVQARQIGEASRTWFNTRNGLALAKEWLAILKSSVKTDKGAA